MSNTLTSAGAGAPANGDPAGNTTCLCNQPPKKKIPIVFSPGVMGSRLNFPKAGHSWDPDDTWAMLHWVISSSQTKRNEMRWTNPATVMGKHGDITDDEAAHGYGGVVESFYVAFLRFLRGQVFNQHVETPVYGVGYDWRQSNRVSGQALIKEVNRILGVEGAGQCILVSHSMGGMVTRSAMKDGLAGKVLGAIHITQPVDGAVVMYRRCFTGCINAMDVSDVASFALHFILGNAGDKYTRVTSGMPGAMQLLPTNNYKDAGKPWLNYKEGGATGSWAGDVYDLYTGTQSPPGIHPPGIEAAVITDLQQNLRLAKAFHAELGRYQHGNTRTIDSNGIETDCSILFDPPRQPAPVTTTTHNWWGGTSTTTTTPDWKYQGAHREAPKAGDGTVPRSSANVLSPCKEYENIQHGDACKASSGAIWNQVKTWIEQFVA